MPNKVTALEVNPFIDHDDVSTLEGVEMTISIDQLSKGKYHVPDHHLINKVMGRDENGDVTVWRSHQISRYQTSADLELKTAITGYCDLIVLDDPKVIAALLVTNPEFDTGSFEDPVAMTLARASNWVDHQNAIESPNNSALQDQIRWMQERVYQNLGYDRYHFSAISIQKIVQAVDEAIMCNDWPAFVSNLKQLYLQREMQALPAAGQTVK